MASSAVLLTPGVAPPLAGLTIGGPASARLVIDGRSYVNFCGSGYLALSNVPEIRSAVNEALSAGAPFAQHLGAWLGGVDPYFEAVERAAVATCATEASVYFASGYFVGCVALACFEEPIDVLLIDEGAHYSLKDAAQLAERPVFPFAHCDVESLRDTLKRCLRARQRPLVLTDGVFATTGRIPPLADYASILAPYEGRMLIDEAHAFGVVGEQGRGAAEYCGVEHLAAAGATLSKAFCTHGAIVGCSARAVSRLRALPQLRGACAGSPLSAVAATASLTYVLQRPQLRQNLSTMTQYFRAQLRSKGLEVIDSPAPIVSFQLRTAEEMQALQQQLFERGIVIYHSTYLGAGPQGMIRCAVFRDHTQGDIDALITALG